MSIVPNWFQNDGLKSFETFIASLGFLDTEFDSNKGDGAGDTINSIAVQPDGKILAGGRFATFNGTTTGVSGSVIRLNADGTLDTAFTANGGGGVNNEVFSIGVQPDGKVVVGGAFTRFNGTNRFNGTIVNRVVRLQ